MGYLGCLWRSENLSIPAKVGMLKYMVSSSMLCGNETLMMNLMERRRVEVFDMKCLRRALGVNAMDRIRNRDIIHRC